MLRQWRNSEAVSQWMELRQEITPEIQEAWFARLDPAQQYFYVVEYLGQKVGLVNLKNFAAGSAEGGIYIAVESLQDHAIGLRAMLAMYDFGFQTLGLHEITAHILSTNKRAIRVNQAIGAVRDPGQDGVINQKWRILPDAYWAKSKGMRAFWQGDTPA